MVSPDICSSMRRDEQWKQRRGRKEWLEGEEKAKKPRDRVKHEEEAAMTKGKPMNPKNLHIPFVGDLCVFFFFFFFFLAKRGLTNVCVLLLLLLLLYLV